MKAPVTLTLYGAGLAAVFAASFAIGAVAIPAEWSESWTHQTQTHPTDDHEEMEP